MASFMGVWVQVSGDTRPCSCKLFPDMVGGKIGLKLARWTIAMPVSKIAHHAMRKVEEDVADLDSPSMYYEETLVSKAIDAFDTEASDDGAQCGDYDDEWTIVIPGGWG